MTRSEVDKISFNLDQSDRDPKYTPSWEQVLRPQKERVLRGIKRGTSQVSLERRERKWWGKEKSELRKSKPMFDLSI